MSDTSEREVMCGLIGEQAEGETILVKIRGNLTVDHLRLALADEYYARTSEKIYAKALFLAKERGNWIRANDHLKAFLKHVRIEAYMEMPPALPLRDPSIFGQNFQLGSKCIHVLVQLIKIEPQRKRLKQTPLFKFCADEAPTEKVIVGKWFKVSGLSHAGINYSGGDEKMVFCRHETLGMLEALDTMEHAIQIYGAPGIGKSITTWFWAWSQAKRGKSILWLHVDNAGHWLIRLNQEGAHHLSTFSDKIRDIVFELVPQVLIIDGVTKHSQMWQILSKNILSANPPLCQVITVASMSTPMLKTSSTDYKKVSTFQAFPWALEEYCIAMNDKKFFEQVVPYFVDEKSEEFCDLTELRTKGNQCDEFKEKLIKNKYYYAGSSARWMLATTLPQVLEEIAHFFLNVTDVTKLLESSIGEKADVAVNHLMSCYSADSKLFFTSEFIARQAIYWGGRNVIIYAYRVANAMNNASVLGWIVKKDFVWQMENAQDFVNVVSVSDNTPFQIEVSDCKYFDSNLPSDLRKSEKNSERLRKAIEKAIAMEPTPENLNNLWLVPNSSNQPSYDLVCLHCTEKKFPVLRFIRVTRSSSHHLKLQYIRTFAKAFTEGLNIEIHGIEIFMVIPKSRGDFHISDIEGHLSEWSVGDTDVKWNNPMQQVKILCFQKTN